MAAHEYVPLSTAGATVERGAAVRPAALSTPPTPGAWDAHAQASEPAVARRWTRRRRRAFVLTMAGSVLVSLSAGSNYAFSAWAPQLQAALALSGVQTNLVGLAGNAGVYVSAPLWGPYLDRTGPSRTLYVCSVLVLAGYGGLALAAHSAQSAGTLLLVLLLALHALSGVANAGAFGAGMNALARSASAEMRSTALGVALAGYALSASAYSGLSNILRLTTTQYLALVALGSAASFAIGGAGGVAIVPPHPGSYSQRTLHAPLTSQASFEGAEWGPYTHENGVHMAEYADHNEPERLGSGSDNNTRLNRLSHQTGRAPESAEPLLHPPSFDDNERDVAAAHSLSGWVMVRTHEFGLLFAIMVCVAGSGLLLINNVGTITQTLWRHGQQQYARRTTSTNISTDTGDAEALRLWQGRQVIAISLGNALGRFATGILADLLVRISGRKASKTLLLVMPVSTLCLATQLVLAGLGPGALRIESVYALRAISALNGITYGTLFGLCPTLTIDFWGLSKFSSNWGIMALSPAVGGNVLNLYFGWVYDAHVPPTPPETRRAHVRSLHTTECTAGNVCYQDAFRLSALAGAVSLLLSICLAVRRHRYPETWTVADGVTQMNAYPVKY